MMGDPEAAATQQPSDEQPQPASGTSDAPDTAGASDTTEETGQTEETDGIQPEVAKPIYKP